LEAIEGLLLVFNKTIFIAALLTLTILGQIFILAIAFTMGIHALALPLRIGDKLLADLLILYYFKNNITTACKTPTNATVPRFK